MKRLFQIITAFIFLPGCSKQSYFYSSLNDSTAAPQLVPAISFTFQDSTYTFTDVSFTDEGNALNIIGQSVTKDLTINITVNHAEPLRDTVTLESAYIAFFSINDFDFDYETVVEPARFSDTVILKSPRVISGSFSGVVYGFENKNKFTITDGRFRNVFPKD